MPSGIKMWIFRGGRWASICWPHQLVSKPSGAFPCLRGCAMGRGCFIWKRWCLKFFLALCLIGILELKRWWVWYVFYTSCWYTGKQISQFEWPLLDFWNRYIKTMWTGNLLKSPSEMWLLEVWCFLEKKKCFIEGNKSLLYCREFSVGAMKPWASVSLRGGKEALSHLWESLALWSHVHKT